MSRNQPEQVPPCNDPVQLAIAKVAMEQLFAAERAAYRRVLRYRKVMGEGRTYEPPSRAIYALHGRIFNARQDAWYRYELLLNGGHPRHGRGHLGVKWITRNDGWQPPKSAARS